MRRIRNLLGAALLVALGVRLLAFVIEPAIPLLISLLAIAALVVWWRGRSGHLS